MNLVERRVRAKDLPESLELKPIEDSLEELRVVEMSTGDRLLCRGSAVYVPASMRGSMMNTLHLTHSAPQSMLKSARDRIFEPNFILSTWNVRNVVCIEFLPPAHPTNARRKTCS